jgi:hypothetical protein
MTDEIRDRLWKEFVARKEPFAASLTAACRPVYSWPQGVRRAYVLTWPLAAVARCAAVAVIGLLWLAAGAFGYLRYVSKCRWYGVQSIWE